eukprot:g33235.t1
MLTNLANYSFDVHGGYRQKQAPTHTNTYRQRGFRLNDPSPELFSLMQQVGGALAQANGLSLGGAHVQANGLSLDANISASLARHQETNAMTRCRDYAFFLAEQVLCTELLNGANPSCDTQDKNRHVLELLRDCGDWEMTDSAVRLLSSVLPPYDFTPLWELYGGTMLEQPLQQPPGASARSLLRENGFYQFPSLLPAQWVEGVYADLRNSVFEKRGVYPAQNFKGISPELAAPEWG